MYLENNGNSRPMRDNNNFVDTRVQNVANKTNKHAHRRERIEKGVTDGGGDKQTVRNNEVRLPDLNARDGCTKPILVSCSGSGSNKCKHVEITSKKHSISMRN